MPFLHWETDRNRTRMVEAIEAKVDAYEDKLRKNEKAAKSKRQEIRKRRTRAGQSNDAGTFDSEEEPIQVPTQSTFPLSSPIQVADAIPRTIEDLMWQTYRSSRTQDDIDGAQKITNNGAIGGRNPKQKSVTPEKIGISKTLLGPEMDKSRRLRPSNYLAQLLVDAARLYEAITMFRDRQILETYLFENPLHIHPRRSLDQAYTWKLKTTRRRDRDQVVYRYTRPDFGTHRISRLPQPNTKHGFICGSKKSKPSQSQQDDTSNPPSTAGSINTNGQPRSVPATANGRPGTGDTNANIQRNNQAKAVDRREKAKQDGWEWVGHEAREWREGCQHCAQQITKVARAVMVDQLWMWVLDENTILTSFPKRYGVGRKDPSGVHSSIRDRMKDQANAANHMRSVFDLALIILEEAFDTFFDRSKTPDGRPQILDMFAESIGRVVSWIYWNKCMPKRCFTDWYKI
jgi:hypothetical protein